MTTRNPTTRKPKTPFTLLERALKRVPTWLFVAAEVLLLALLALWVEVDLNLTSIRDVVRVLFENAESIAIVAAVILYFKEIPDRKTQKHYEAWQVIDNASAAGVATSYARFRALEDLNSDGVSLCGIDIPNANLQGINLERANLSKADLSGADLTGANLTGADLTNINLTGANLFYTTFSDAILIDATLTHANLSSADLSNADLTSANLSHANLVFAALSGADLTGANLSNADLMLANLSRTDLTDADFYGAKRILLQQIKQARNWQKAEYDLEIRKQLGLSL